MFQLAKALLISFAFPEIMTRTLQLSTFLEQILTEQFSPGSVIVFSLPSWSPDYEVRSLSANSEMVSTNGLIELSNKIKWPLVISTDSQSIDKDIPDPQHGYVILLFPDEDIVQSLEIQIEALRTFSFSYNRRGIFIVVVLEENIQDPQLKSKDILLTLWKMDNIINSIAVTPTVEKSTMSVYNVYTMFPYISDNTCGESDEVVFIDQWIHDGGFRNGEDLFPPKVPSDLNGCTLTIEFSYNPPFHMLSNHTDAQGNNVYKVEGINYMVFEFISKGMNFSMAYVAWESAGLSMGRLMEGRNINGGVYALTPYLCSIADFLIPHSYLKHQVYIFKARPNSVSGDFLEVFSSSVWAVSVFVLLLGATLFRWYQMEDDCLTSYRTFSGCLLNTWAVFLSASVDQMPRKTNFRIFFYLFVIYCFAVNTVFQSCFTSFLIEPGYEKQIHSMREVNDRHMPLMYENLLLYYDFSYNLNILKRFDYHIECEDLFVCLEDVYKHRKGAIFSEKFATEFYFSNDGIIFNEKEHLYNIHPVGSIAIAFVTSRGHPLLERFNVFIRRCLESGLPDNYYSHLIRNNALKSKRIHGKEEESFIVFGLLHLQMCFEFYGIGCILSITLFILECLHAKRVNRNKAIVGCDQHICR
ncbi:Ionotropic receptor 730 [Blattella germanica]|nr:Ionotropic receptor 730 [Blattella germanica]